MVIQAAFSTHGAVSNADTAEWQLGGGVSIRTVLTPLCVSRSLCRVGVRRDCVTKGLWRVPEKTTVKTNGKSPHFCRSAGFGVNAA